MGLKKIIAGCLTLMALGAGPMHKNYLASAESPSGRQHAASAQSRKPKNYNYTGERTLYYDSNRIILSKLDMAGDGLPEKKVVLHDKIKSFIEDRCSYFYCDPAPADMGKFKAEIFRIALSLGYDNERIRSMEPKEAIILSADIVRKQLKYGNPILNKDASGNLDENTPADAIFYGKRGVCSDYASLTSIIFKLFKEYDKKLENAYVMVYETIDGEHTLNEILFVHKDEMQVAYMDVTWADTGYKLDFLENNSIDPKFWAMNVLGRLGDCTGVETEGKNLIMGSNSGEEKTDINKRIGKVCAASDREYDKKVALEAYERIMFDNNNNPKILSDAKFETARIYINLGDQWKGINISQEAMAKLKKNEHDRFIDLITGAYISLGKWYSEEYTKYHSHKQAAWYFARAIRNGGNGSYTAEEHLRDMGEKFDAKEKEYMMLGNDKVSISNALSESQEKNRDLKTAVYSLLCCLATSFGGFYYMMRKMKKTSPSESAGGGRQENNIVSEQQT